MLPVTPMTPEEKKIFYKQLRERGRIGGMRTRERYGLGYYKELGAMSALKRWGGDEEKIKRQAARKKETDKIRQRELIEARERKKQIELEKAREIFSLRKEGWSFGKIGEKLGYTRQRIHQLFLKYKIEYNIFSQD